jgi:hypothetical protein
VVDGCSCLVDVLGQGKVLKNLLMIMLVVRIDLLNSARIDLISENCIDISG